jgi:hypothetical protein
MRAETRRALAASLQNLLDAAEEPDTVWRCYGVATPVSRHAILAAHDDLLALSNRLSDSAPASLRGLALAALLVADETSPMYPRGDARDVKRWARNAHAAMALHEAG